MLLCSVLQHWCDQAKPHLQRTKKPPHLSVKAKFSIIKRYNVGGMLKKKTTNKSHFVFFSLFAPFQDPGLKVWLSLLHHLHGFASTANTQASVQPQAVSIYFITRLQPCWAFLPKQVIIVLQIKQVVPTIHYLLLDCYHETNSTVSTSSSGSRTKQTQVIQSLYFGLRTCSHTAVCAECHHSIRDH